MCMYECMYICMHIDLLYYCAVMMAGMASSSSLGTFILAHCYLYSFVYTILVSHKLLYKKKLMIVVVKGTRSLKYGRTCKL